MLATVMVNEERFRPIVENNVDRIMIVDQNGTTRYVNESAEAPKMYGDIESPRGPAERDFRYTPTSHGESSKCKEVFFYCNSLANPAASRGECARCAFSNRQQRPLSQMSTYQDRRCNSERLDGTRNIR
jgi:hypothetical protein